MNFQPIQVPAPKIATMNVRVSLIWANKGIELQNLIGKAPLII